ncbi:unnamed protein product [Ilex paraguariensis]|uniref:S-locus receptor kinase C-terminal domain-containing protein n=1 Tax=Ilex paraguariensis TaxID=185542 RepID=A0ABC8R1Y1_9AQUA
MDAWELWQKDAALELMDPMLSGLCITEQLRIRCIHIGLLCVEDRALDWPAMPDVISMLTNDSMTLPMPRKPGFLQAMRLKKIYLEMISQRNIQ